MGEVPGQLSSRGARRGARGGGGVRRGAADEDERDPVDRVSGGVAISGY